jgi:hypothetical protein
MAGLRCRDTTIHLVQVVTLLSLFLAPPALSGSLDKKDPPSDTKVGEPYRVGVDAFDKGDYETALKAFKPLSEDGDTRAQIYLGTMYEKGLGLETDLALAAKWYRRAANGALRAFYRERENADQWRERARSQEGAVQALEQMVRDLQQTLDNIRRQLPGNHGPRPSNPQ